MYVDQLMQIALIKAHNFMHIRALYIVPIHAMQFVKQAHTSYRHSPKSYLCSPTWRLHSRVLIGGSWPCWVDNVLSPDALIKRIVPVEQLATSFRAHMQQMVPVSSATPLTAFSTSHNTNSLLIISYRPLSL